jgi:hypothetical protein
VTFAFDAYPVDVASDPFPIYRTMRDEDPVVVRPDAGVGVEPV